MQASMDQMEHKILVLESRLVQNQGIPLALQQSDEDIPVIKLKPSEMETPKYSGAKTKAPASVSSKRGLKKKYNDLYSKFKMGDCQDTVLDFDEFAKTYPESSYADNAIYWIGECFYKGNEFRLAISEFEKVPKLYPDGNKAPDAYLRMAMSFKALGDSEQAQQTYLKLLKLYPNTDAAHKAKKVLVDLPVEYGGS
jgi:tol-pal system protein YbgF